MTGLQLTPVVLSLLVLGAHFLRASSSIMVAVVVIVLGLLAVPGRWAARAVQAALLLGTVEWMRTLADSRAGRSRNRIRHRFLRYAKRTGVPHRGQTRVWFLSTVRSNPSIAIPRPELNPVELVWGLTHLRTRAAAGAAGARTGARSPPSTGASVARDPSRPRRPPTASPAPLPAP